MNARATKILRTLLGAAAICAVLFLLVALRQKWVSLDWLFAGKEAETSTEIAEARTSCTLTPEKIKDAGLHETTAQTKTIRELKTVPGSIIYDSDHHLKLTAPVDSVAVKVLTETGQKIEEGAPLVVLSSSAVGLARDEVLQHEAELSVARKEQAWADDLAAGIQELMTSLKRRPKLAALEQDLEGKTLGNYREKIVGAYSKLILAELAIESAESLTGQGGVARRITEERRSARETAAAVFAAAGETARFEAIRAADKAKAQTERAQRLQVISREHLATLLGPFADNSENSGGERLSEFTLRAPLQGRVVERQVVTFARLTAGSALFTLADTRHMRVSAEIHERDWQALEAKPGEAIQVRVPALAESVLSAKVRFIGSEVSAETHSVPLVADIGNLEGSLRPGMFVWVEIPVSAPRQTLVVPASSVVRHEDQPFVFVPKGNSTFRRVDVEVGLETRENIEILSGLKPGDRLIDRGAFILKSELLLEAEE